MELINNIWMVLSTPNEFNTMIFTLPLAFVELFLFMKIFLVILELVPSKKKQFIFTVLATTTGIISKVIIPGAYNVFINYFLLFIIAKLIFNISAFKALIGTLISFVLSGIVSVLVLNPFLTLLNISSETLAKTPIYSIAYSLLIYAFLSIIICILKYTNFKITLFNDINSRNKKIIILNFIFATIALSIQTFILVYYIDNIPIFMTFLGFLSLISYLGISIYSLTKTI